MTEKFKYVKIISFTAVVMALIILLSAVITPGSTNAGVDKYEKAKIWALDEPENTIDAIFLGDSEVYSVISPMELWNKYGYATFDCSSGQIKSYEVYDLISSMLERQNPKIIMLETYFLFREYDAAEEAYNAISEKLPLFKYHDVWKSYLNPNQEYESITNYTFKGYICHTNTKKAKNKNYMIETDKVYEPDAISLKCFDKIYNLCKEKGIELVLFNSPSIKNWDYSKHNAIAKLAKKYKLEYLDLNLVKEIGIDWSKDTRDAGDHVNHTGAVKVTSYIGEYLAKKDILEDHRDDPEYSDWNDLYEKYLEKVNPKKKK